MAASTHPTAAPPTLGLDFGGVIVVAAGGSRAERRPFLGRGRGPVEHARLRDSCVRLSADAVGTGDH